MRNWFIGTGMAIGGGVLALLLLAVGFSRDAAFGIGMAVAVSGFIMQMHTAFSMRASFERKDRLAREQHEALMRYAKQLPPEQAIRLLLGNIRSSSRLPRI